MTNTTTRSANSSTTSAKRTAGSGSCSISPAPAGSRADLYLGTVNGQTIERLLRADPRALRRRRSLHGFLGAAGYAVVAEAPQLIGGHTVRTYGSHKADGLDAIQIEITLPIRKLQWQREALIEHLAQAIARRGAVGRCPHLGCISQH
jgi:hypothetical protein